MVRQLFEVLAHHALFAALPARFNSSGSSLPTSNTARYRGCLSAQQANHYATLGLHRDCRATEIRDAYRLLAKRFHPDLNGNSAEARLRTQELNAAYEVLSDAGKRRAYDHELNETSRSAARGRSVRVERNVTQDVRLRIDDFLRGTSVEVQVRDPANPDGTETYQLHVPAGTAPGARFRLPRAGAMAGGFVLLRVKALPGARFKVRGSDLQCELRIDERRAAQGGNEMVQGPLGNSLRVQIPPRVRRGEILRVSGEGLPKPRGGRGDLLVRVTYRVRVSMSRGR
jgi:DnaJ-class molecular chaperone